MERLDVLVRQVRDQTGNQQYTSTQGIRQREFVRYANDGQMRIYNRILMERSSLFMKLGYIDVAANDAIYDLPTDIFLKHNVLKVDYSSNGDARMYAPLDLRTPRQEVSTPGYPDSYFLRQGEIVVSPIPLQSATRGLRLNYQYILPTLDLRRAKVTSVQVNAEPTPWTLRTSSFVGGTLRTTKFLNGKFFSVGDTGVAESSPDGTTWTVVAAGLSTNNLTDIIYAGGYYIICGANGSLSTSTDGITFTANTSIASNFGASAVTRVIYNTDTATFVAVGPNAAAKCTTPTGTWSVVNLAGASPADLIWVSSLALYVAACGAGVLITSPDAVTWTNQTTLFAGNSIQRVINFNGTLVAFGNGLINYSLEGVSWLSATSPFGSQVFNGVALGEDVLVAVTNGGLIGSSTDGITFTSRANGHGGSNMLSVVYEAGCWVVAGASGKLSTSKDGTTWLLRTSMQGSSINALGAGLTAAGYVFVAGGTGTNKVSSAPLTNSGVYDLTLGVPAGQLLNDETIEDLTDGWSDGFSIVDSSGDILASGLIYTSYNSTTRLLRVTSTASLIGLTGYLTFGSYSTTHSQLPDVAERYLSEYMAMRIQMRDSNAESVNQSTVLRTLEEEIIDSIANLEEDLLSIAILDSSMLNYDQGL